MKHANIRTLLLLAALAGAPAAYSQHADPSAPHPSAPHPSAPHPNAPHPGFSNQSSNQSFANQSAALAPAFDLDPFSFTEAPSGVYRSHGVAVCVATNAPPAPALSLTARIRPERCDCPNGATLGIAAYETPYDYWKLSLVKPSDAGKAAGKRNFELKAMVGDVWGGEKNIARRIRQKQRAQWEYGREYDFALKATPERVAGVVRDAATGEVLFEAEWALEGFAPGAPAPLYRPALAVGGWFGGTIRAVETGLAPGASAGLAPGAPAGLAPGAPAGLAPGAPAPGRATTRETPFIPSGPDTGLFGAATGFFHMERIGGRDWPIDPTGRAVILAGAQHIKPQGVFSDAAGYSPYGRFVATNYPTVEAWADETLARLGDWGFTMLGNACALGVLAHKTLPHVRNLQMGQRVSWGDPEWHVREWGFKPCSALPNVFHPDFQAACEWRAREQCAPFKDDPWLVGWFIDNELAWWGTSKRIRGTGLYGLVAALPPEHSARRELERFLAERGLSADQNVPREAKVAFLRHYARTYYEKTTAAIRKADPNHMILGSRYAGLDGADPVVWEEAGRFCDVVTFNCYPWADLDEGVVYDVEGGVPMTERLREYYGYAKAPLMITEWSFPALDQGHPCTRGAGQRLRTQAERVEATMLFAKTMLADPHVVGYDHFKWNDQPKTGSSRYAPEDCNYGLVNDDGIPYEGLTQAFKALHGDLVRWRLSPPPKPRPQTRPSEKPAEHERYFAEAHDTSKARPVAAVLQTAAGGEANGDRFSIDNGLIRLSGRIGSKWLADEIAFCPVPGAAGPVPGAAAPVPVGRLGALLAAEESDRYRWLDTTRLASVAFERDEATGAVSALLRGLGGRAARVLQGAASAAPTGEPSALPEPSPPETAADTALAFAITLRVTLLPGAPDALIEIESLENLADTPLDASALYIRAFSRNRQDGARTAAAPKVWGKPKTATWAIPGGGEWGLTTRDRSVRKFQFFLTPKDGVQHPDAAFSPVLDGETFTVAPGETWRATVPMGATLFKTN